jgi:hypothetical protein
MFAKRMGWTQNPPGFGPWGFKSPSRHHGWRHLPVVQFPQSILHISSAWSRGFPGQSPWTYLSDKPRRVLVPGNGSRQTWLPRRRQIRH